LLEVVEVVGVVGVVGIKYCVQWNNQNWWRYSKLEFISYKQKCSNKLR